jgi:serine/threonine-protein kinase
VADVYRAHLGEQGNYEVAVKVFRPGFAQRASFRDYFMTRAEKIGQFDHPNILPFLQYGEGENLLYVVTPFVTTGTLEDLLRKVGGRFSAMQALPIVQQLCSALQYAHERDVIHGNIKPSNVFVGSDGRMMLADFGITRSYEDSQQSPTRIGWGSAEYASPEQSLGVLRCSSDIYSLGVLLFRILAGSPPFTGQTPVEVLLKHVRQQPPSARSLVPNISDAVDGVLRMALQKRSDDRFASAEEFSNAFFAAVTVAPVASPVARSVAPIAPEPSASQSSPVENPLTPLALLDPYPAISNPQTPLPPSRILNPSASPPPDASAEDSVQQIPAVTKPLETSPADVREVAEPMAVPKEPEKASRTFSGLLHQLLPVVVVILLLLGLAGALLSSFLYK